MIWLTYWTVADMGAEMQTCFFIKPCILLIGLVLFMPVADYAAGQTTGDEHSRQMQQMREDMRQMEKDLETHRSTQHCMPEMKAHCQAIADMEYMEKRMKLMRAYMQYCAVNEKDCRMPEMTGEMKALRDRLDALGREMQHAVDKPGAPQE